MQDLTVATRRPGTALRVDAVLVVTALLLLSLGLVLIYSATHTTDGSRYLWRQVFSFAVGLVLAVAIAVIPDHYLRSFAEFAYLVCLLLLLAVYFRGETALGAKRWFSFLGLRFQPSEFLKLAFVLLLAKTVERFADEINSLRALTVIGALSGVTFLGIVKQPDLGTALSIAFVTAGVLFIAGVHPLILAVPVCLGGVPVAVGLLMEAAGQPIASSALVLPALGAGLLFCVVFAVRIRFGFRFSLFVPGVLLAAVACGVLLTPVVWNRINPYQRQRLTSFLKPEADSRGSGYQSIQSIIAIGSGGMWGKGLFRGPQNVLGFLPHRHTDFIFSVLGEEAGFFGASILLFLSTVLLARMIAVAMSCRELFGTFAVVGVACLFAFHLFVNVGMTVGLLPVTGLPLLLVSYGGSSLVSSCAALGIVLNLYRTCQGDTS